MPSRSSSAQVTGRRRDVDVIAPAVPAEDRLLLGLGGRGAHRPWLPSPDRSGPDVRAPGRIQARRSRRSPNRIKRLRESSRIARTKAPRGRWIRRADGLRDAGADRAAQGQRTLARRGVPDPILHKPLGSGGAPAVVRRIPDAAWRHRQAGPGPRHKVASPPGERRPLRRDRARPCVPAPSPDGATSTPRKTAVAVLDTGRRRLIGVACGSSRRAT